MHYITIMGGEGLWRYSSPLRRDSPGVAVGSDASHAMFTVHVPQFRHRDFALVNGYWAAVAEDATPWRIDRARHIAGECDSCACRLEGRVGHRYGREKGLCVRMERIIV